jgi:hypothetical protein
MFKALINKFCCCHEWQLEDEITNDTVAMISKDGKKTRLYYCKKCGKFKTLNY